MLFKNGQNLTTLAETADNGDTRHKVDWIANKERFIEPYFADTSLDNDFMKNGIPTNFCKIGCRPRFGTEVAVFNGGTTAQLLLQGDGTVNVVIGGSVTKTIPTSQRIIIVEAISGGGGGSGGSAALNGVGGGAGAFALFALRIDKWQSLHSNQSQINIVVGTGGNGVQDRDQADNGTATSITDTSGNGLILNGGSGANVGDPGDGGTVQNSLSSSWLNDVISIIANFDGSNGYSGLSGTHTFNAVTHYCGNTDESQCAKTYGPYSVTPNEGGAGGNSYFGVGGTPGSGYGDDGNEPASTAYGAGGGGGRAKSFSSTIGGRGADGYMRMYY